MQNTVVTDIKKWDTVVNIEGVTKYFDQNRPVSLFKREKHRIYALKDVSFTLKKASIQPVAVQIKTALFQKASINRKSL